MNNIHLLGTKKKPVYYYHFLLIILLTMCLFLYTAGIIYFFKQFLANYNTIVLIYIIIFYMVIICALILAIYQYKHSFRLYDSFKNISYVLGDNNISGMRYNKMLNIEELINCSSYILGEPYIDYKQLADSVQQLENKLEYSERLERVHREFIANVSHEMKSPIGLLVLYAEGLKDNVDNIDKDYYCDVIIEVVENLNKKINRLMSVTTIDSGLSPMRMESFNYSELFKCIIERYEIMLLDFNTCVEYDKDIYVYGDMYYLGEVIKNFITNAVAYTDKGREIKIELKKVEKYAELSIYNESVSMETECLEAFWKSFYKGKNKCINGNADHHIGMGLYIVKLVMEQHNGIYGVDNMVNGLRFYTKLELV